MFRAHKAPQPFSVRDNRAVTARGKSAASDRLAAMADLRGKTLFITGASRGIGKAIGLRAARDGANVVIAAKTVVAHPKLPGTIFTAAAEIEDAGGRALAIATDIRSEDQVAAALEQAAEELGGIDILVNNASAIYLAPAEATPMKRFDLMHQVNARGTFLCSKLAIAYLKRAENPHILTLAPPLNLKPKWFAGHTAYTMAKYRASVDVRARPGRRAARRRHRGQRPVAGDGHRHGGAAHAGRRGLPGADPDAGDRRRRGPRRPHPAEPAVHGKLGRRGGAPGRGGGRSGSLRGPAGHAGYPDFFLG